MGPEINGQSAMSPKLPQTGADLRKLILKLRWIGHETEAEELCAQLARLGPQEIALDLQVHTD